MEYHEIQEVWKHAERKKVDSRGRFVLRDGFEAGDALCVERVRLMIQQSEFWKYFEHNNE